LTIIRSAVVTHPPFVVFTGTNAPERISFLISEGRASINESAGLTRGTSLAIMWRDYAAFAAAPRMHVSEFFARDTVPRMKPIIRAQKQN
jgi:hypothetical protein